MNAEKFATGSQLSEMRAVTDPRGISGWLAAKLTASSLLFRHVQDVCVHPAGFAFYQYV